MKEKLKEFAKDYQEASPREEFSIWILGCHHHRIGVNKNGYGGIIVVPTLLLLLG
jgi:hypothetical protein